MTTGRGKRSSVQGYSATVNAGTSGCAHLGFAVLAAAGDIDDPGAKSAARAAQMAVAIAYSHLDLTGTAAARQTMHLLAPVVYAAQAHELATGKPGRG